MANRGPKKLTSAELKTRGSRSDIVKRRAAEEGTHAHRLAVVASREPPVMPEGLHATAQALWTSLCADFTLDDACLALLNQAMHALSRAEEARAIIDRDGMVSVHPKTGATAPHVLLKTEHDSRLTFHKLTRELGFYTD